MKKLPYLLLLLALFSCRKKEPTESDFMSRAIQGNDYKIVFANFKIVQDSLVVMKKRPVDTNAVKYEYNTVIGTKQSRQKQWHRW
jgi:hypothetical protein